LYIYPGCLFHTIFYSQNKEDALLHEEQQLERLYKQLDDLEMEGKPVPTALLEAIAALETRKEEEWYARYIKVYGQGL